ncbi:unnamed protein product [Dovyalis caffra]|uniref:Uncharacterized protein n=1 Tax=Dovyalis caffra TaxID=77055 RepID=A0AAV1RRT8_9ROSI|nr:unnamed protein product [Dovyalis caffra]
MEVNNYAIEPMLRSCGISIGDQFTQVQGRVPTAPKVPSFQSIDIPDSVDVVDENAQFRRATPLVRVEKIRKATADGLTMDKFEKIEIGAVLE